jgi:undecaprenyl-diphosphatase
MSPFFALILGVVEGFTEYLPVSSTGHLVLVSHLLGENGEGAKAFDIVIQLGAILAVVVHYRQLLVTRVAGLFARDPKAIALAVALAVGFLPAAVMGFLLRKTIKEHLFGPLPVAIALLVGGVVMIAIERYRRAHATPGLEGLEYVTPRRAFLIGVGQCFSLWPGASRSMCTIVAGQLTGLSTSTAAEFSFLLALPTLTAATVYEGLKSRHELLAGGAGLDLAIGLVVSFLVAWAVIAGFLRYLQHRGLEPFGYYRIVLAALVFFVVLR